MKRGGGLHRATPLARGGPLRRVPFRTVLAAITPYRPAPAVPPPVRAALKTRSRGLCEAQLPGCRTKGTDPSHRITSKSGGRHGEAKVEHDRLSNITFICRPCHRWLGTEPTQAKELGLALAEWQDPTVVPVLLPLHDHLPILLVDDGTWRLFEDLTP